MSNTMREARGGSEGTYSPDGRWRWNGTAWVPVDPSGAAGRSGSTKESWHQKLAQHWRAVILVLIAILLGVLTLLREGFEFEVTFFGDSDPRATESPLDADIDERNWVNRGQWADLGQRLSLGDWDVAVTEVDTNANQAVLEADEFSNGPHGQFVLVTYQATYNGPDRSADPEEWIWLFFVGSNRVSYWESLELTPAEARGEISEDVLPGETITDEALFDVPEDVIDGGAISVEVWDSEDEDKEYHAAFTFEPAV
jgi:hypothetical protein